MDRVAKLCIATLAILLIISSCVFASPGRILFSSAWDDNYLYVGFVVDDSNVTGSNKGPNSKPWEDDEIELLLDVKHDGATSLSPNTYRMAVSAAGGSNFAAGKDGGWESKSIVTYKYGSTIQGTINNADDVDRSFSVEVALPWTELGGKPAVGQKIGVNVLRTMKGEAQGFVSLAPLVKTVAEMENPSKWVTVEFVAPGTPLDQVTTEKLLCPHLADVSPLVDGLLKAKEWRAAAVAEIEQPDTEAQAKPQPQQTANMESKELRYPNETLVLSPFYYWFQGDPRKPNALDHVRKSDGALAMTDEPTAGAGPWMSYDRVQWYKDELQDMRKAGIDAALPVYRGDSASRKGYADKGLDCLGQALKELKAEGKEYPLIGMFLDTSSMQAAYGTKPNLLDEEPQRALYGMVNDFFSHVPEEFLLVSQLDPNRGRQGAYVVLLSGSDSFGDIDPGFVRYCDTAFARDFRGARLLWIGDAGLKQKVPGLDGYITLQAGLGAKFDDTGWLDVAAVGPGYDDKAVSGPNAKTRSRETGKTYQDDWTQLLAKRPDIVIVDSWNGLHEGTEICPTKQYGYNYSEMTAVESIRARGMREYDATFLRHNIPAVVAPQAIQQVDLVVKNTGTETWRAGQGFGLSYRWFKNDKFVDDGVVKVPLLRDVQPNHIAYLSTGILAQDKNGQAIPPGQYELHFEMLQGPDKWFSEKGDVPLVVSVRVGLPTESRARFISSTLPTFMKSGSAYPFKVSIRNDGANTWKRGANVEAICRLYKVSTYMHDAPEEKSESVDLKTERFAIPSDVEPGRVLELTGVLKLVDSNGKPIPVSSDDLTSYRLRWALWADKKWLGEGDGNPYCQLVSIIASDSGAQFAGCVMPKEIEGAKPVNASVTIKNSGTESWKGGQYTLCYHWYSADGRESVWNGGRSSIRSVAPGQTASMQVKVVPPANEGQCYLVWDVAHGSTWTSTTSSTRGGDTLCVPVTLKSAKTKTAKAGK